MKKYTNVINRAPACSFVNLAPTQPGRFEQTTRPTNENTARALKSGMHAARLSTGSQRNANAGFKCEFKEQLSFRGIPLCSASWALLSGGSSARYPRKGECEGGCQKGAHARFNIPPRVMFRRRDSGAKTFELCASLPLALPERTGCLPAMHFLERKSPRSRADIATGLRLGAAR